MFALILIVVPVAEVFAFGEVGLAIGWLWAVLLLLGTSVLGVLLMRVQGRRAIQRVATAVSERRAPGGAAIDGALGFLGAALLVVPGFVTDAVGALLMIPAARMLTRRVISRRYGGRVVSFASAAGRFVPGDRSRPSADVDSTATDGDVPRLGA